jgi:hypothetical protein
MNYYNLVLTDEFLNFLGEEYERLKLRGILEFHKFVAMRTNIPKEIKRIDIIID